jgi:hypothetical protein
LTIYYIYNNYIISYYLFVGMKSAFGSMNDISAMKGMGVGRGRGGRGKRGRERERERERERAFLFCLSVL